MTSPSPDTPFRILVLGDFSGRTGRGLATFDGRSPLRAVHADRDNLEKVFEGFGAELRLQLHPDGGVETLRFSSLDDFRPERLFLASEMFGALRRTRQRLSDPATFDEAAAEVRSWAGGASPEAAAAESASAPAGDAPPEGVPIDGLFDDMLTATEQRATSEGEDWDALVRELVAPQLDRLVVPGTDPDQPRLLEVVDAAIAAQMRNVLHHSRFQALEAAWRGLFLLVRRLETDESLQIHVLDTSKPELAADLGVSGDLSSTRLFRLLVEETEGTVGADPWSLLVGLFTFDAVAADVALLLRIAKLAAAAGAPFVAGASGRVVGCASIESTPDPEQWTEPGDPVGRRLWTALRQVAESGYLALFWPRILLRMPYGEDHDEVEDFPFEEFTGAGEHDAFLWGNPALICAHALGQGFTAHGWKLRRGLSPELDGLPTYAYRDADGDSQLKPCAEWLLSARAVDPIRVHGVIPVISVKGEGKVLMGYLTSLTEPASELLGRWA